MLPSLEALTMDVTIFSRYSYIFGRYIKVVPSSDDVSSHTSLSLCMFHESFSDP